jgi:peptidoglycan/LPS O-acetylase OafA/YrhL
MAIFSTRNRILEDKRRIASLDYWRAIAILSVTFFHARLFDYGFLGVDIFFVLSGYLISRVLIDQREFFSISVVKRFVIARAFKIWPSYYAFLLLGSLLFFYLYPGHPSTVIHGSDWFKYLFFYQNYRGTNHIIYDHIWSICVEEHFYLILPIAMLLWVKSTKSFPLSYCFLFAILAGNILRSCSYLIHFETYSATHNRIDALSWGCLLYALESELILKNWNRTWLFLSGLALFFTGVYIHHSFDLDLYRNLIFHGLMPFAIFLLLAGSLHFRSPYLDWLKYISYYSYSWYLWHQVYEYKLEDRWHYSLIGKILYLIIGFAVAMLATHLIEEPGLGLRERWRKISRAQPV